MSVANGFLDSMMGALLFTLSLQRRTIPAIHDVAHLAAFSNGHIGPLNLCATAMSWELLRAV
jgi:hypothetical protein